MSKDLALVKSEDLSLVSENSLNPKQLKTLLKKTPQKYVKQRPAKGGGKWDYVTGGYVKKCLNIMFGWDWDFEIMDEKIMLDSKEVIVKGKLTCRSNGKTIVKMQYGNKDIIFKRGSSVPLSIGNDLKSASTDALKKCASEIGIAADIYNKEDFKEVKVDVSDVKSLSYDDINNKLSKARTLDDVFELWSQLTEEQQTEYGNLFDEKQKEIKNN
jgi:hypothetical protein